MAVVISVDMQFSLPVLNTQTTSNININVNIDINEMLFFEFTSSYFKIGVFLDEQLGNKECEYLSVFSF